MKALTFQNFKWTIEPYYMAMFAVSQVFPLFRYVYDLRKVCSWRSFVYGNGKGFRNIFVSLVLGLVDSSRSAFI